MLIFVSAITSPHMFRLYVRVGYVHVVDVGRLVRKSEVNVLQLLVPLCHIQACHQDQAHCNNSLSRMILLCFVPIFVKRRNQLIGGRSYIFVCRHSECTLTV